MLGRKARLIQLLERELRDARTQIDKEVIKANKFFELVNKTHVRNFFYQDRFITGQPEWIKKEDAVKFKKLVSNRYEEIWCQRVKVEELYTTKEVAKFYKSAIVEWNKKAIEEECKQKKALAETKKKLKNQVENPRIDRLYGTFPVMVSSLVPQGMMVVMNSRDKEKFIGNIGAC